MSGKIAVSVLAVGLCGAVSAFAAPSQVTVGKARFTILTDRMIRCEYAEDGVFEDRPSFTFVNRDTPPVEFTWTNHCHGVRIRTAQMDFWWRGGPFNSFSPTVNGKFALMQDSENLLGTARTLDQCGSIADVRARMEQGILSRRGVTAVDDTHTPLLVKTGDRWGEWVEERPHREKLYQDYVIFAHGHDYRGALKDYTLVAGKIPLPPRWAFGYWWSRYWKYDDRGVRDLVDTMRREDVPIDVFIIDMDWHKTWVGELTEAHMDEEGMPEGWTGYTWEPKYFPKPEETLSYLHAKGVRVALNLHPHGGIRTGDDCYAAFCREYGWTGGGYVPYRMSDRKWADVYFGTALDPLERQGVDFWWLDWQQWANDKDLPSVSNIFWLNHCFFRHQEMRGERGIIYHRWGGLGSHRYQAGFSGDTFIRWDLLAAIPWFTATSANVGYGYWGHDVGGHCNPLGGLGHDGEYFTRWVQSAVFLPLFRTHSSPDTSIERRIWAYPKHKECLKAAFRLRYRLIPYIYTMARKAHDTGVSICHPLYYDWPEEEEAYKVENAYMFGDSILAATISKPIEKGKDKSEIELWLPPGKWYDVSSKRLLDGGRRVKLSYSIAENPWLVKAGAVIPMYPEGVRSAANPGTDKIELFVAPGGDGTETFELYEDDGVSRDYDKMGTWRTLCAQTNDID